MPASASSHVPTIGLRVVPDDVGSLIGTEPEADVRVQVAAGRWGTWYGVHGQWAIAWNGGSHGHGA